MVVTASIHADQSPVSADGPAGPLWPLTLTQYHRMIEAGILTEDDPVELLEGYLVRKMPKNPPHRAANRLTGGALERVVPAGWYVDTQEPITLDASEPEPDVMVIRGDTHDYLDRHPGPADVALLVEIGDISLPRDQSLKKPIYAAAGIPVYWIVNLAEGCLEVCSDPSGPAAQPDYRQRRVYGSTDTAPLVVGGQEIGRVAVADLLPQAP